MDNNNNQTEEALNSRSITVKKDGISYEIMPYHKISDLLDILIPNWNQGIEQNKIQRNKQNFVVSINQTNELKIKAVYNSDYFAGKSELEELKHPFFANQIIVPSPQIIEDIENNNPLIQNEPKEKLIRIFNNNEPIELSNGIKVKKNSFYNSSLLEETNKNKKILNFDKDDKIMVFSPHPDDEILGACGLLYKCFQENYNVKVVYMTSGKSAGDANIRKKEAIQGIKTLGGSERDLIFTSMPFYEKKDRVVTEEDTVHAIRLIEDYSPNKIFICSDIYDPNGSHRKCYEILLSIYNSNQYAGKIKFYFYYSVWYWPKPEEYSHILPYDFQTYKLKIYAMLEHKSQLVNQFMGSDPRPFYQRATARDEYFGTLHYSAFCEVYYAIQDN